MYEYLIFNKDFAEYEYLYGDSFAEALENHDLVKEYNEKRIVYIRKSYIDMSDDEEEE